MLKRKVVTQESNKEIILNTAIEFFSNKGYSNTSIRDITRKAKVSIGTLYFHFKNKKDILKEVFIHLKPAFDDIYKKNNNKLSFVEYFKLIGKGMLKHFRANIGFNVFIINEGMKDPDLAVFFYELFKSEISIIAKKMSEYSSKENLRKIDYEKLATNLLATMTTLAIFNAVFRENIGGDFLDDMLENYIDVNFNGLVQK